MRQLYRNTVRGLPDNYFTTVPVMSVSAQNNLKYSTSIVALTTAAVFALVKNDARKFLFVQNNDSVNDAFINFGGVADSTSMKIAPGAGVFLDHPNAPRDAVSAASSLTASLYIIEGV